MAEIAGTIVGVLSLGIQVTEGLVKYYTAYKNRSADIRKTLNKLNNVLNMLEILRKQLGGRKFRSDEQTLLDTIERCVGDCEDAVNELQGEIEKLGEEAPTGIEATARTVRRRLTYPFRESTLMKLEEDVDDICLNLTLALQILQRHDLGSVEEEIQDTKTLIELVRTSQLSADVRDWLKAPDASINYNDAAKKRYPGTGLWFVKGAVFLSWLAAPNSFLWLCGFAGCGKSVLSSTIIQHTLRHRRSDPLIGIAFFYFVFSDESKQDTSAMLRTLILQLTTQLPRQDATVSRLRQSYRGATPPDNALLDCLHQLIRKFDHVYIVLDALDETTRHEHRKDLLQALEDIRQWSEPGLHLLVTSRDEQDIREHLNPPEDQVVAMKNDAIDADIASFVTGHLKDNWRLRKWEKHYDQIERALIKGAKGVFRWVECQFTALEACPASKTRLDSLLGSLPRTLDKTYERMLSNIDEESAEDAKRILTLLCTAKRPLTVRELIDGIAVELGDNPMFNEDSKLMNEHDIRHICPGFIEVDLQLYGEATVRIAHYSVQEYLESERIRQSKTAKFSMGPLEANTEVASICLTYLLDPGLCMSWVSHDSGFYTKYPLAVYAARHWPAHYHEGNSKQESLHCLAVRLFRNSCGDAPAFVSWVNIYKWDGYKRDGLGDRILTPIYLASRLGLEPVVRDLAGNLASISSRHECFGTALIAAAEEGHVTAVRTLLDHGADINYGGFQGTALHVASGNGHLKVVEELLVRCADIEAHDYRGKTPLYNATSGGDEVVRLLLDRGANINPIGAFETPLEAAVSGGDENVVALLLDRGAEVNRGRYQLPLEAAREHPKVEQLLLSRGAEPIGETPLETAAYRGDIEAINKHLSWGDAPINVGIDRTPLEAAISAHQQDAVKLLLDAGAGPNLGKKRTPLEEAVHKGNMDLANLLIDKGADVNRGIKRTPLEAAADRVDLGMAQLLIGQGADVNLGIKMTPMEAAAQNNRIILYMRVNDAAFSENVGSVPLKDTAKLHIELMRLLLDHGADVNAEGGDARYKELVEAARAMNMGTRLKAASE